jgi:hypothetical protein
VGPHREALVAEPSFLENARFPTTSDIAAVSESFGPRLIAPLRTAIGIATVAHGDPHLAMGEFLASFQVEFARQASISVGAIDCGPDDLVMSLVFASVAEWLQKALQNDDGISPVAEVFERSIPGSGQGVEFLLLSVGLWLSDVRVDHEQLLSSYAVYTRQADP